VSITATLRIAGALALAVLAGCGEKPRRPVLVGSKTTTEQQLLGEIIAQHLERTLKVPVDRRLNLGDTKLTHQALILGEIDLYAEYTGTAFAEILELPVVTDPAIVRERVQRDYQAMHLVWLPPLGFNSAFVGIVRADDARRAEIANLSGAARSAEPWVMAARPDFIRRFDGLATLDRAYKMPVKGAARMLGPAAASAALLSGQINMVAGRATDALLLNPGTAMLADDLNAFPPYEAAIIARQAALSAHPGLREALELLSGRISLETMRRLNSEVDLRHRSVAATAAGFLRAIQ
jgi:osmoprotectant transport system substrate-binding protein